MNSRSLFVTSTIPKEKSVRGNPEVVVANDTATPLQFGADFTVSVPRFGPQRQDWYQLRQFAKNTSGFAPMPAFAGAIAEFAVCY